MFGNNELKNLSFKYCKFDFYRISLAKFQMNKGPFVGEMFRLINSLVWMEIQITFSF